MKPLNLYSQLKSYRRVLAEKKDIEHALKEALHYAACGDIEIARNWGADLISRLESAGVFPEGMINIRNPDTL